MTQTKEILRFTPRGGGGRRKKVVGIRAEEVGNEQRGKRGVRGEVKGCGGV